MATLKAFAKRNAKQLYKKQTSRFDGMTDCNQSVKEEFTATELSDKTDYYATGIQGIYTVGSSDDHFDVYEDKDFYGIEIYNCCGTSILAVKKIALKAEISEVVAADSKTITTDEKVEQTAEKVACELVESQKQSYQEAKSQEAVMNNCFFAFSDAQLKEGLSRFNLTLQDVVSGGSGLVGTREGIKEFYGFYENMRKRISEVCDPQEVYDYEFGNYECDYVGDDEEAINIVVDYFGIDKAKTVKRKWGHSIITEKNNTHG